MNGKMVFVIAFMAVISGVYGLIDILRPAVSEPTVKLAPERPLQYVTLWRSNEALVKGSALTPSQVVREQVEMESAIALGFKDDVTLDFTPTVLLNTAVKKGDLIWEEFQTHPEQPGYIDLIINDGMTLFPLQVSTKNLITNFIHPGDYIDVLSVSSPKVNLAVPKETLPYFTGAEASIFLHHVKVMSIGSQKNNFFDHKTGGMVAYAQHSTENENKTTVVIEIKPSDIARLSLAQRTMHLEMYRSYRYQSPLHADMRSVIKHYTDVEELRGASNASSGLEREDDESVFGLEKLLGFTEER